MRKILIIEDHPAIRENLEEFLEISNFQVTTVENGQKGLDQIQQEKPDIILCDIAMPVLNGYQVLEAVKRDSETSKIPFVFLSSSAEQRDIKAGKLSGADAYITKPFPMDNLIDTIEQLLSETA